MAIETQPESAQAPGGGEPGAIPRERSWWLRPSILTAIVGAAIGYVIGHWLGNYMTPGFVPIGGGAPDSNDLVPIMIGSKRVAFPRIEALSFWLTPCAYLILLSSFLDGGFPTGWTGYAPLSVQAGEGMDGYAVAFGLMGISVILAGFN